MGLRAFLRRIFGGAPESKHDSNTQLLEELRDRLDRLQDLRERVESIPVAKPVERWNPDPAVITAPEFQTDPVLNEPQKPWSPLADPRFPVTITLNGCWIWHGAFSNASTPEDRSASMRGLYKDGSYGPNTTAVRYAYGRMNNVDTYKAGGFFRRDCAERDCVNPDHHTLTGFLRLKDGRIIEGKHADRVRAARTAPVQTPQVQAPKHVEGQSFRTTKTPRITMALLSHEIQQRVTPGPNDCILWTGRIGWAGGGSAGYPVLSVHKKTFAVRRLAYMIGHGLNFSTQDQIPPQVTVGCGNHLCVNPKHVRGFTHDEMAAQCLKARAHVGKHKVQNGANGQLPFEETIPVNRIPEGHRKPVNVIAGIGVVDKKKT